MKSFLILLALGLAASDKLDRTYLPPPGAQFAGGRPEDLGAPLELPHQSQPGIEQHDNLSGGELGLKPLNYGDKIHKTPSNYYPVKVPMTTTSIAFAQTTTFPTESYETTAIPINPVTGLPITFDQTNQFPGINQGQLPTYGVNVQPGSPIQGEIPQSIDNNQGYGQTNDQPLQQYPGLNVVVPEEVVQIPGSNQGLTQYSGNQVPINGQQGQINNGAFDGQYPGENVIIPEGTIQIQGGNQGISQYPYGQTPENSALSPSLGSPQGINLQQNYGTDYPGSQGFYEGQPIQVANLNEPFPNQGQSAIGLRPIGAANGPIYRPERPQAAADRNAVILNYENVRYPNGYSYSYDTSNGIHADETGTVGNGTRAQGSYSYTGDDGKVYTVVYTADENGFQPRGDHLPTSPPIPEAIQKVIEQAARDEAAGIFDDGSYDKEKYGDKKYMNPIKGRRPQKQRLNRIKNRLNGKQENQVKPIAGITDVEEDQNILDKMSHDLPNTETRGRSTEEQNKLNQPMNQESRPEYSKDVKIGNNKMLRPNKFSPNQAASTQLDEIELLRNKSGKPTTFVQQGPKNQQTQSTGRPVVSNIYDKSINGDNIPSNYPESGFNKPNDKEFGVHDGSNQPAADFNENNNQYPGQKPIKNKASSSSINQNDISQKPQDNSELFSDYVKDINNKPLSNQQDETGYYYQKPNATFSQTDFPSRFSTQGTTTTTLRPTPDQVQIKEERRKPLRPFITPGVYNQNGRTYSPTTRRPFTTVGVTSPAQNAYTDYDDDDYEEDKDIYDARVSSTKAPVTKIDVTSRPYQSKTSGSQYIPTSQQTYAQKGISAGRPVEDSSTPKPGYSYGTTTPTYQTTQFGTTEAPRRNIPYQQRPVISKISASSPDVYNYGTTNPSGNSNANVAPGYTASSNIPGFGTRASTPETPTTQVYPTSTYRPVQDYSIVTGKPQSTTYGQLQPISDDSSRTGYYYDPPKTVSNEGFFNPRPVPSTQSPNAYQTTYPRGSIGDANTTPVPSTPRRQGTFILTEPGSNSPTGTYQDYNGPSTDNYSILRPSASASTPPGTFDFNPQTSSSYEYGPTRPVYSTTPSVSTYGPTPTAFIPSETPGIPNQGHSTTYRPIQTLENGPLVDGFGRPIPTEQSISGYPVSYQDPTLPPNENLGYTNPQYDTRIPILNPSVGPNISDNLPVSSIRPENNNFGPTTYPENNDQPKIIGEDFTGPKQPQRFDPKTGYHY